ncbi:transmembrane protein 116-like [Dendronephthya gigantea]|uniref:transmembrane protein 116-like n=1 Tax=Dendronephthya gigantea TaxID=151771 RepID=UPI00106D3AED|nr:transmembrane protein 116-like [Dendronephthya gigantea]
MAFQNSSGSSPVDVNPALCVKPSNSSPDMLKVLAVIYMVSSFLSIIGALSIIIFACKKRIVCNYEIHPLFHLSVADFFLACGWFITTLLWWVKRNDSVEAANGCFYLEIVTEIFHVASFFLTVNYATHVFVRIKQRTRDTGSHGFFYRKLFFGLYILSWVGPVLLMLPMVIYYSHHDFLDCSRCLLLFDRPKARMYEEGVEVTNTNNYAWRNYGSLVLVITLGISIVLLLVLYFLAMKTFTSVIKRSGLLSIQQRELIESNKKRVMLYIVVFFICWFPAFVVAFIDLATEDQNYNFKKWFFVFLLEGIFTPMQGFFNSLVYGWTRNSFRRLSQNGGSYRRPLVSPDGFTASFYGAIAERDE